MPRASGFNGGTVRIRVIEAEGLLAMDSGGFFSGKASSDPYVQGVVASVGRKDRPVFKTEVCAANSHPLPCALGGGSWARRGSRKVVRASTRVAPSALVGLRCAASRCSPYI